MYFSLVQSEPMSQAGPSRPVPPEYHSASQTAKSPAFAPTPVTTSTSKSPLPGPIRKSAAALRTPISQTVTSGVAGRANAAEKLQSSKTLLDSFKSLTPNARIAFGVVLGIVAVGGLYWDRWSHPEAERQGDKPVLSVRMVDRER